MVSEVSIHGWMTPNQNGVVHGHNEERSQFMVPRSRAQGRIPDKEARDQIQSSGSHPMTCPEENQVCFIVLGVSQTNQVDHQC